MKRSSTTSCSPPPRTAQLVVDDKGKLAGLSDGDIAAAAQAAKDRKLDGKWVLTLQNTTQQPVLQDLTDRATRQALFEASWNRAEKGDANDTRDIIERIAQLRAQKAKLLGFPNYAAWTLEDQMAKTPETVMSFMDKLAPAAVARAKVEAADIQKQIDKDQAALKQPTSSSSRGTGSTTPSRCARPNTTSTSRRSSRTSSWTTCCRTACSTPPTSSTA